MKIVDSHCHIDRVDLEAFGGSVESMLSHAKDYRLINSYVFVLTWSILIKSTI